jgi:ABC-type phosphate transport system substrate-binding protein
MEMSLSPRLGWMLGLVAIVLAGVLALPGAAFAKGSTAQCSGENIGAQGASVESVAQTEVWDPQFNKSSSKLACSGSQGDKKEPTITYKNTGSGEGLESWGEFGKVATNYGPTNAFIGTSETPTQAVLNEIQSHESPSTANTVENVPVTQLAIAIIVNLPTGCTASSTAASGRLVLNNTTLEGIYNGSITQWSQIKDDGDTLSGGSCNAATPIIPVVRFDQAGTTHILKRYLNLIDGSALVTEKGSFTWGDLSEAELNTTWPSALPIKRPAKKGDSEVASLVASTPGSIGYGTFATPASSAKPAKAALARRNSGSSSRTAKRKAKPATRTPPPTGTSKRLPTPTARRPRTPTARLRSRRRS